MRLVGPPSSCAVESAPLALELSRAPTLTLRQPEAPAQQVLPACASAWLRREAFIASHPRFSELHQVTSEAIRSRLLKVVSARRLAPELLIRFVSHDREILQRILVSGTDRTDDSNVFTQSGAYMRGNDADPAVRAERGITPAGLTYAFRLSLAADPLQLRWGGARGASDYPECSELLGALIDPPADTMVLVYDPRRLALAPDAEVEYWFTGQPRDALVQVFAPSRAAVEQARGENIARYIFEGATPSIVTDLP